MKTIRHGDIVFEETFLFARRGKQELRFTRHERALLLALSSQPRKLLRREQLLDVIAPFGSETSDRNIDFLINRLRAKLGDSARSPRFIATQYGEGYVWIAEAADAPPARSLLVIGPVFGLNAESNEPASRAFLLRLHEVIDAETAADQSVVLVESWHPGSSEAAHFSLEISFHADGNVVHCAAVLRETSSRHVIEAFRLQLDATDPEQMEQEVLHVSGAVRDCIWRQLTAISPRPAAPTDTPMELRLHDAALLLGGDERSWLESGARLAAARRDKPDCSQTALMWGMHLYARLLLEGPLTGGTQIDRFRMESEIEALVFKVLPQIRGDSIMEFAAAKLLFFIDRGHLDLAEEMTEAAFARTTAFAAAFAMLGQVRLGRGRLGESIGFYDRGIELAEQGSPFHIYLLVLKCGVLLATGDRGAFLDGRQALYAAKPASRNDVGAYLVLPEESLPSDIAAMLQMSGETGAHALLDGLYYSLARHCGVQLHRENVMRGLIAHVVRRFGAGIVPQHLRFALPGLFVEGAGLPDLLEQRTS
jgi:DNA-binding winged helix-turn-helix (wHTH) protein